MEKFIKALEEGRAADFLTSEAARCLTAQDYHRIALELICAIDLADEDTKEKIIESAAAELEY